ncbi:DEAD/DEAH box helicase family protein [Tepidiforma flava]|uniref:DEAD/DEAH box helicase family protein n=1 Tax=Tepidiforma flava TaxID=3004094 RepID=A0ABY7M5S8_9CHLR|nr:DEAD/DEAH box helicase family protein [Tepidiforma flava]WBL35864.1 DEAD/DEAH box helicase family protein [Tepidiforma flava]
MIDLEAASLRPGQAEALRRWREALAGGSRAELVVVPVGYGKTVIGVGSFLVAASTAGVDTCLYLTPTDVLRTQVYDGIERALALLGARFDARKYLAENATLHRAAANRANVVVATYQQVAAAPERYARLCARRRVHLVCDEAHHLGERGQWAGALRQLPVATSLLLSATPVRLDREPLAGARYLPAEDGDGLVIDPLVHVTMRQAWREGRILKRLAMQMKDYAVELRSAEGEIYTFTASEMAELPDFDQRCVRQQLRWNDDYVEPLVREFAITLERKRALAPGQHQGLVFAATTAHADHLARVFAKHHPGLRCTVVHSGEDLPAAEAERRMRDFHAGRYDVLIQVRKASEGFDAPTVSVLLKLDAVFSREPVIQQLGRGLRFNHSLPEAQNVLHVFIGRDPRLAPIIDHLEREAAIPAIPRPVDAPGHAADETAPDAPLEEAEPGDDAARPGAPEIVDVIEAGDAVLDETGRLIEGQQLTMFGVPAPPHPSAARMAPPVAAPANDPRATVVDLQAELQEAIEYCKTWTARAARERARRFGQRENHFAVLNAAYARETGQRGTLATPADYRRKGDWMKRKYLELLG